MSYGGQKLNSHFLHSQKSDGEAKTESYDGCTLTLLFVALQYESVICSKLSLHHLFLPNAVSPVVFSLALSNAGLSKSVHITTASQVPLPPSHPVSQGNNSIATTYLQTPKNLGETTFYSVKFQEYQYYICISPEPTNCELLSETQTPDLCKRKHS